MKHTMKSMGAKMGIGCKPKKKPKPESKEAAMRREVRESIDAVYKAEVAVHEFPNSKARKKALVIAQNRKDKAYATLHKANCGVDY